MHYIYLAIAIIGEVVGINALKASEEFTKPLPVILGIVGYICTFYFLVLALRVIPMGVAYAIWAGLGIIFITATAYLIHDQKLDLPALIGISLIIVGVVVIQVFSDSIHGV